ncbi:peripheral-type benzodiazepine receptor-associated protein 1 isoform X3 [Pezoporus wallicus]|uniref:peripheral-type benzodiazepine receptor-associated protein 1 isoform X3 n=1 Tax=Pezoporus wallicus TaxID=35540 RepID=UPI00254B5ABB|nr:peripheral-type benzodiazepine receptor-associated protein 1 isoform X3 [Pezoporus wallicus]
MQDPELGEPSADPAPGDAVPAGPDPGTSESVRGDSDRASCRLSPEPEGPAEPRPQKESPETLRSPPPDPQRVRSPPELVRPLRAMDGLGGDRTDRHPQSGADYGFLVSQNTQLLSALEDLRHRCSSLAEENSLLRRSCFPQTEEKVKHLKRKNAELAVIAKRLEERARKLQEANLKVVTAPVPLKGSSLELCKKAFARQRAKDLTEQASALLAKDKQIDALQQECRELQAKLFAGKDDPHCLNVTEFDRLLRESQREVLRLQRQIALKNFKECLRSSQASSAGVLPSADTRLGLPVPMLNTCNKGSPLPKEARLGDPALKGGASREVEPSVQPLGPASEGHENFPPRNAITDQESSQQIQQLEFELKKKRKKCENLEHEVRKKHKRCKELEIQLQEVQSENARLAEENLQLNEKAGWAGQVEAENADLKLQVVLVTKERDSVIQTNQGLQSKLENLEQVLKHMRNVAERRQQLEVEHKEALLVLQEKQDEVRRLQQAQAEAKREHEGAVQLLESTLDCMQARVKDLEEQCRSQTEQFSLLSQELKQFRLQTGKIDLLTSTLVTSELPLALCSSTPQPHFEKESTVPGVFTHQSTKKVHNEETDELQSARQAPDTTVGSPVAAASSQRQAKKVESQSNSSKSESMQNSPKSCPTPEVDTASEMEELDVDSISLMPEPGSQGPAKLQVFLARYSYNPFDGPNENPEAELPLTAGEYIYIYGEMDEDGFFEGELMDGRRGLVPSNFVERVSDDDLVTFLPSELNDLTHSSYREKSFVSASTSSGDKSDFSVEESSISPLTSRAEGDQEEPVSHTAVPYPRKLTLIKQLARSIVVGWEPPLLPAGCPDVQSYNIYVDEELRQNVKSGFQTKAVIEKLDLKTRSYRVSVQTVTEQGSSDKLRCTFFVGQDFCVAPTMLKVRSVTATSAELTWLPCNSNYNHAVYLNGEECDITKPGVYWYTFHSLQPSTQYVAKLEARPLKSPWEEVPQGQEQNSAVIHFTTPLAGTPDAPLDVQVEAGPSPGILVISWLPVTIDAEGSSNGVRVTGYAVYADGQKVIEVTSPTAGSVLVDLSQLQMFQVCREVSVRTMSLYGESVDSVPAQISPVLLQASHHSSPSDSAVSTIFTSRLPRGEPRGSLPSRSPPTHHMAALLLQQNVPSHTSDAKLTDVSSTPEGSAPSLPEKASSPPHLSSPSASLVQVLGTSPQGSDAARDKKCLTVPPQQAGSTVLPGEGTKPVPSREAELQGLGEGTDVQMEQSVTKAPELESPSASSLKIDMETCYACSVEESPEGASAERGKETKEKHLSPEPLPSPSQAEGTEGTFQGDISVAGSSCQEFLRLSPGKEVMKEMSRVEREQEEKLSDIGRRPLTLFAEHSRSSDLSDILEEEEEDELSSEALEEKKWDQGETCYGDNGEKMDLCDTDSDEEILERILELPLQKNHSKKLFSIPEVTEDEDEDEDEDCVLEEKADPQDCQEELTYHSGRTEKTLNIKELFLEADGSNTSLALSAQMLQEEHGVKESKRDADHANPAFVQTAWSQRKASWNCGYQQNDLKSGTVASPARIKKKGSNYQEKTRSRSEMGRKRQNDLTEHCSRLLGNCSQMGGGLYRAPSLREELNIVSSAGAKEGFDMYSRARQGTLRKKHMKAVVPGFAEPAVVAPRCSSPRSLEIDIEYDSEDDEDSICASPPERRLWPEMSQSCQGDWSDGSSQSEVVHMDGRRDLTRLEMMEEQGMEWAGSPSRHLQFFCQEKEALRCESSSEEQGWELDCKSPGWRRRLEHPSKGIRSTSLHKRVASNKDPRGQELPRTTWQAPRRRGNKSVRRSQMQKPVLSSAGPPRSIASETSLKDDGIRIFVALFDYDPVSMSPNPDAAEEELPFKEGQILKVCGDKDADGFYRGECAGREGYIPCNMVSEVQVENNEIKKQLLKQGFLPANTPMESIGNGTFSPPPRRQSIPPPKPRRSKKEGLDKQEKYKSHAGQKHKDCEAELLTSRRMVAVFDYNPKESSPNADVEAELTFSAGDIITVFGSMDDDGFYYGELNQQRGLVPSNFLEAEPSAGGMAEELHSKDKEAFPLSAESQLNPDGSLEQSDSSPTPPTLPPSCLGIGEQCPEQASLAVLKYSDVTGQSKKKRGFFLRGKELFRKLGSSKKN